jgi:hypothetical protein
MNWVSQPKGALFLLLHKLGLRALPPPSTTFTATSATSTDNADYYTIYIVVKELDDSRTLINFDMPVPPATNKP